VAEDAFAGRLDPDPVETELKLAAASAGPLQRLTGMRQLGSMRLGRPETFVELDRYLDTGDGRLAAAGWACRHRSRAGRQLISLKGPPAAAMAGPGGAPGETLGGALHRRPEIEGPASARLVPGDWPASAARDRLLELTGGRELHERLALRQRRTERSVRDRLVRVGTLSLDQVSVVQHGATIGRLWCVELELERTTPVPGEDPMRRLLADLLAVGGLAIEPLTKLERAVVLLDRVSA
jgi:inorganic triphosphatase YgiF